MKELVLGKDVLLDNIAARRNPPRFVLKPEAMQKGVRASIGVVMKEYAQTGRNR